MLKTSLKIACVAMLSLAASGATAAVATRIDTGNGIIIEKPFQPDEISHEANEPRTLEF